jgi:hypothetical protein
MKLHQNHKLNRAEAWRRLQYWLEKTKDEGPVRILVTLLIEDEQEEIRDRKP